MDTGLEFEPLATAEKSDEEWERTKERKNERTNDRTGN